MLMSLLLCLAQSQPQLSAGIQFRKSHRLYWDNGIILHFSDGRILGHRVELSGSYITSRLGSAIHSNALKEDYFLCSLGLHFRPHKTWDPYLDVSAGYYRYATEHDMFDFLDNQSAVMSVAPGFKFNLPRDMGGFRLHAGYHIAGDLYPFFYAFAFEVNFIPGILK